MALGGMTASYNRLYRHQDDTSTAAPEVLDTNGEPLLVSSRYWVVDDGEQPTYIYNDLIDVDNYLENFKGGGHDSYQSAVLALYGYCPEVRLVTYLGRSKFEEEK
ncbi:hypothetical protein LBR_08520 [Levilactobacillus brevis]|uniref:hypothetical protein n=1 Tax=Levilactobacillus brevis TaxID=1580 RepID=UPI000A11C895|nr:hypothetical protein [Levilactobacillus brevis]ORJ53963.1 hypothetical protein LBR_08520 [Levilactobacillus brevis]